MDLHDGELLSPEYLGAHFGTAVFIILDNTVLIRVLTRSIPESRPCVARVAAAVGGQTKTSLSKM